MADQNDSNDFQNEFVNERDAKGQNIFAELVSFAVENKKWWLIPIIIVFAFLGLLVVVGSTGAAPFIYTLF